MGQPDQKQSSSSSGLRPSILSRLILLDVIFWLNLKLRARQRGLELQAFELNCPFG